MRRLPAIIVTLALIGGASDARAADREPVAAKFQFGFALSAAPMKPRAIGSYAKGCLAGAAMLPVDGPAWQAVRLSRNRNWGHPALIELIERFAGEMRALEGWPGLLVGDLSQPRGGPMLTGHKSHQIGLDADIWYMPMPDRKLGADERETLEPMQLAEERGTAVIGKNWHLGYLKLMKRAASYAEVERIFVHPAVKKALCENAGTDRAWLGKVRPIFLHNYHFHVRIACPKGAKGCEPQKQAPAGDGCGKPVEDWIKIVSRPLKATPAPTPGKPVKPARARVLTLANLPAECRAVLASEAPALAGSSAPTAAAIPLPERRRKVLGGL